MTQKYDLPLPPFVDRKDEKKYISDYLTKSWPASMLFVYWPKSSGKTTLIEKIINELPDEYIVSYTNFRRYTLVDYTSFVHIMFQEAAKVDKSWNVNLDDIMKEHTEMKKSAKLWFYRFFQWSKEEIIKIKNKEYDPFVLMQDTMIDMKAQWYRPVLVFDELQELRSLYMNWDAMKRELLREIFAFFISITKEQKLAHVIVLTSESTFIDEVYNNVKLKNTSKFYMIEHLKVDAVYKWLKDEWINKKDIDLIWQNLWGSPHEIWTVLVDFKNWIKLQDAIDERIQVEYWRIDMIDRNFTNKQRQSFLKVVEVLIKKWKYNERENGRIDWDLITKLVEKDIWFYDSINWKITANSESVRQAFKKIQKLIVQ